MLKMTTGTYDIITEILESSECTISTGPRLRAKGTVKFKFIKEHVTQFAKFPIKLSASKVRNAQ